MVSLGTGHTAGRAGELAIRPKRRRGRTCLFVRHNGLIAKHTDPPKTHAPHACANTIRLNPSHSSHTFDDDWAVGSSGASEVSTFSLNAEDISNHLYSAVGEASVRGGQKLLDPEPEKRCRCLAFAYLHTV